MTLLECRMMLLVVTGTVGFVIQVLVVLDLSLNGIRSVFCSNGICTGAPYFLLEGFF